MVIKIAPLTKAPATTKTFYRAKHAFGAFTVIETTNAISLVITSISPPQWVYQSLTRFHPTTKTSTGYNLPAIKP